MDDLRVWTIGHSTHPLDELVALLRGHGVTRVVDIRKMPGSRRYPHVDEPALAASLPEAGIEYQRLAALGGLRRTRAAEASVNDAWRNASFRAYADYMQTPEFAAGVDALVALAGERPTAIMCAEAVPWRCHRSLVADALLARGAHVADIMGPGPAKDRSLTSFARVEGHRVWYPAAEHG